MVDIQRIIHIGAMVLLIFGGLNYGALVLFGTTLVQKLVGFGLAARILYSLIALSAVALIFHRSTYLPFLGETVMPACNILAERVPEGASTVVKVRVAPGVKVLYWAAEPGTEGLDKVHDWREAYAQFKNAGVTVADVRGNAYLKVRPPKPYTVPFRGTLDPHVHYRVCQQDGMMSRIETMFLTGEGAFASGSQTAAPTSMFLQNTF